MEYKFTVDWFSQHIPLFSKYLSKFKDKEAEFLEIGSYEGRSAIWMLENINPKVLYCVEPGWTLGNNKVLEENLSQFSNVKIIPLISDSSWQHYIFKRFDFIYIDGAHASKNCLHDMILHWGLLKTGGIMAVDDYELPHKTPDGTSPKEAIDYFLVNNDRYALLHKNYQCWLEKLP